MLRTQSPVRALTTADRDEALQLCAQDPAANVFVAARIEEGALRSSPGSLLGFRSEGRLAKGPPARQGINEPRRQREPGRHAAATRLSDAVTAICPAGPAPTIMGCMGKSSRNAN